MATSIDDNATDEKSDKSIWRLLNIHCTRRLFQKSALLISPMNCSAATQLPQGLRSASVGAKRVPLAHSTAKHSKSADLLRKSLLSTLCFDRYKTNILWMFCTSYLARPKLKSLIVQARTTFRAFAPGINKIKYAYFPYCPPRYRSPPRRSPGSVPGSGPPAGYPERRSHHFSAHRSGRRTWPQY